VKSAPVIEESDVEEIDARYVVYYEYLMSYLQYIISKFEEETPKAKVSDQKGKGKTAIPSVPVRKKLSTSLGKVIVTLVDKKIKPLGPVEDAGNNPLLDDSSSPVQCSPKKEVSV
jgi:hypothetical protein